MINWSTEIRLKDYTYFCKAAEKKYEASRYMKLNYDLSFKETKFRRFPVWIVSDCRRSSDVKYFQESYGSRVKTVRITASDEARRQRGWVWTEGIDDKETECGLDDLDHDTVVDNSVPGVVDNILDQLVELTKQNTA